jgi:hypothetical protein
MQKILSITAFLLMAVSLASAQKTNDAVSKQIKALKADKTITLTYDAASNTSKLMVMSSNFDGKEAAKAKIQAMNFGMAAFYPGQSIATPPDTFNFTFWVLTKKPVFGAAHKWTASLGAEILDLGDARYVSKPGENMEYLNFKISREQLTKIAAVPGTKFKLGTAEFTFTADQSTLLKDLLAVSDSH